MKSLEEQIKFLSQALLGEEMLETADPKTVLTALQQGQGPITITLLRNPQDTERQSVVLQEFKASNILVFDPKHELGQSEGGASESGMVEVSLETFQCWFSEHDARALISS